MNSQAGQIIGHNIIYMDTVTSTNDYLKRFAADNISDGTVVVAETQTHGRGRNNKKWNSAPGKGLTFSVLLQPNIKINRAPIFSYLPVIVLTKFFRQHFKVSASVKWPNDIYVNYKKIAGILSESSSYKNHLKYFIIGIGINLLQNVNDFDDNLRETATSLSIILKKSVDKELFLCNFLKEFDKQYKHITNNPDWESDIVSEWNQLCFHMNSRVELIDSNRSKYYGIFKGISKTGEALIKTDRNIIKTLNIDLFSIREDYVTGN